ncbi:MAG TPA: hypothetical protein VF204_11305 [Streptosporangiaceae bacterium]
MKRFLRVAAVTATVGLFLVPAAGAASAAAATHPRAPHFHVPVRGGSTSITTLPGVAEAVLAAGVAPFTTAPASEALLSNGRLKFTFPVSGGSIQTTLPPNGHVNHRGGIKLFRLTGGTAVKISNFNINLAARSLTGILNNNPAARIKIFSLGLLHANFNPGIHSITVSNITVSLTGAAAHALDQALGVPLFHGGQVIGIAKTHVTL